MPSSEPIAPRFWTRPKVAIAVVLLLSVHTALAVHSLLQENPTVDEVAHLPAGLTYWDQGTFKLYHHNPPLVKLVAATPVMLAKPVLKPLYQLNAWENESQATFAEFFALENADRYFELFARARMLMPLFSIVGGLVVFAWSSRLYGRGGGLLSLTLWCLCPNVLAHARLVTSDMGSASIGVMATYLFWRYQHRSTWGRAAMAGLALGLAELTKFSLVLFYAFWPALAMVRWFLGPKVEARAKTLGRGVVQWLMMVAISVVVIDCGYGFEGVGQPLGRFEFASGSLTRPVTPGMSRPLSKNQLLQSAWTYRVNRFRGTILDRLPVPLPRHYVLGFDEQKLETEGVPAYYLNDKLPKDDSVVTGYAVYLNGKLERSGWWYYYLATLAYKVPEGTWVVVVTGLMVLVASKRSRAPWSDEVAVLAIPVGVLGAMSFLTDICLGLRYILPIFPYVFIATGKVVPWVSGLAGIRRQAAIGLVAMAMAANLASVGFIHPHYLAFFNQISGGPARGAEHLIDSNIDWGQDLVGLDRWLRANHPGRPVGLVYFGQINPGLLKLRGEGFDWFLPPATPRRFGPATEVTSPIWIGPAKTLKPGLYAVSATILQGLPWRFYDPAAQESPRMAWQPAWQSNAEAFGYFRELTPIYRVGDSIYVYEVTAADCQRLAPLWSTAKPR